MGVSYAVWLQVLRYGSTFLLPSLAAKLLLVYGNVLMCLQLQSQVALDFNPTGSAT